MPQPASFDLNVARGVAFAHTMGLADAIEAEAQAQATCMQHPDFRTVHDAFKAKYKPVFVGAEICDD